MNWERFLLVTILVFVVLFSLTTLTSRPKLWVDEALDLEIAHNFLLYGVLDISTAPGIFSGKPYMVGTNGYPLTIPLAGVFAVFDFGFKQARIYMLFWLIAVIISFFYIIKRILSKEAAATGALLIGTFGSFYGHGLMATGEMPGFFFFLWGVYFLLKNQKNPYILAGIFFALSAVSKPSIFLLLFPSFVVYLLLADRKNFFHKIFRFGLGSLPPLFIWFWLTFPEPLMLETWKTVLDFYIYPYGKEYSVWASIKTNLKLAVVHTTILYFSVLTVVTLYWHLYDRRIDESGKRLAVILYVYGILAFFYFLKSPGWLRYVIGYELLLFAFLYPSFKFIFGKFSREHIRKYGSAFAIAILLLVQIVQLSFLRSDQQSTVSLVMGDFVNSRLTQNDDYKVGIINSQNVAALVHPSRKYHILTTTLGKPAFGENPLSFPENLLPQFILTGSDKTYIEEYSQVLEDKYSIIKEISSFTVYERK